MKLLFRSGWLPALALVLWVAALNAQNLQLLTTADPAQLPHGGGGESCAPLLTPDGRFVVFASTANNLLLTREARAVRRHFPIIQDVYLRDRLYQTNALITVNTSGLNGGNGDSFPMAISPDGGRVLLESAASDLVPSDTNDSSDIFLRDRAEGTTLLVSASPDGSPGNGDSRSPAMTPDGRFVAFVSAASNLVAEDTNLIADVFVRGLRSGTTVLASVGARS